MNIYTDVDIRHKNIKLHRHNNYKLMKGKKKNLTNISKTQDIDLTQ